MGFGFGTALDFDLIFSFFRDHYSPGDADEVAIGEFFTGGDLFTVVIKDVDV